MLQVLAEAAVETTPTALLVWDLALKTVAALLTLLGAVAGATKYLRERRDDRELRRQELGWRKTEFLVRLFRDFEKDARYQTALRLIDTASTAKLRRLLRPNPKGLRPGELRARYCLDRYLDFFDHLYNYVKGTAAFSAKDLISFSGYVDSIVAREPVTDFARRAGYPAVLMLADEFSKVSLRENGGGDHR